MDCFFLLGVMTLVAAPLVLLTKSFTAGGKASGAH
jgi:MFS transporter, DHA2 family, multidrug resistance protein